MRHSGPGSSRLLIILKVCFIDNIIIAKIILHDNHRFKLLHVHF